MNVTLQRAAPLSAVCGGRAGTACATLADLRVILGEPSYEGSADDKVKLGWVFKTARLGRGPRLLVERAERTEYCGRIGQGRALAGCASAYSGRPGVVSLAASDVPIQQAAGVPVMTIQQKMRATLERAGIPYKQIDVYGRQIVVTSWCMESANRWAILIQQFATLRGVIKSRDDNVTQQGRRLHESHEVWRTFGVIA